MRMAVGGARVRLVQQLLTESLVLALAGGCAGLLLAAWGMAGLRRVLPAQFAALPGIDQLGVDTRVLLSSLVLSLLTGAVFGVAPALVASDQRVGATLNEETRGGSGGARGRRMRSALVVAELALSLVLLVGAGLLMVSFRNLTDVSPGFRPQQLVTTRLTLPCEPLCGSHARGGVLQRGVRSAAGGPRRRSRRRDQRAAVQRPRRAAEPADRAPDRAVAAAGSRASADRQPRLLCHDGRAAGARTRLHRPRQCGRARRRRHQRSGGAPLLAGRRSDRRSHQPRRRRSAGWRLSASSATSGTRGWTPRRILKRTCRSSRGSSRSAPGSCAA